MVDPMADDRNLATDRLFMAPHSPADFADFAAFSADPAIFRFLGGAPLSEEDSWARFLRHAGNWALLGYGFWAIRDRVTGAYLGNAGFLDGRRTGVTGFDGDPEIGWSLAVAAQGRGLATEAVKAALGWGSSRFRRTVAMIHLDNVASVAVAQRCGFQQFAVACYKDDPTSLWQHRFG